MPPAETDKEEMEQLNRAMALSLKEKKEEERYQENMKLAMLRSREEDKPQGHPSEPVEFSKVSVSGAEYLFWLSKGSQDAWKAEGKTEGGQHRLTKEVLKTLEDLGWRIVKVPGDGSCFGHAVGYYEAMNGTGVRQILKGIYDTGKATPFILDKDKDTILGSRWLSHGEIALFCEERKLELVIFDTYSGETKLVNQGGRRRIYVIRVNDNHYDVALPPRPRP